MKTVKSQIKTCQWWYLVTVIWRRQRLFVRLNIKPKCETEAELSGTWQLLTSAVSWRRSARSAHVLFRPVLVFTSELNADPVLLHKEVQKYFLISMNSLWLHSIFKLTKLGRECRAKVLMFAGRWAEGPDPAVSRWQEVTVQWCHTGANVKEPFLMTETRVLVRCHHFSV